MALEHRNTTEILASIESILQELVEVCRVKPREPKIIRHRSRIPTYDGFITLFDGDSHKAEHCVKKFIDSYKNLGFYEFTTFQLHDYLRKELNILDGRHLKSRKYMNAMLDKFGLERIGTKLNYRIVR